jgi:hypothetical protein
MHIDERDEVALATQQQRRQKHKCVGDSWLFVVNSSMAVTCIHREWPPMVTMSHNRLGLSLSKCIRHRLVVKINSKRKLWAYEALGWILVDHSCARRAPRPSHHITSPCHAPPDPARWDKRVCVCVSPFFLTSTLLQMHKEQSAIKVGFSPPPLAMWD